MIPYEAKHVSFDQSIFIDIFVLDGLTSNKALLNKQFEEKNKLYRIINILGIPSSTYTINTAIKKIIKPFLKAVHPSFEKMFMEYESICTKYEGSDYVDKIMFREKSSNVRYLKRDWFSDSIQIEFEGKMFPIPVGYHDVLKAYYGENYMKPAQAPTMHGGMILDTKRSYKEVLAEMRR